MVLIHNKNIYRLSINCSVCFLILFASLKVFGAYLVTEKFPTAVLYEENEKNVLIKKTAPSDVLRNITADEMTTKTKSDLSSTSNLKGEKLRFCAGIHEWPPYYYLQRFNNKKNNKIVGLDIELFNEIFHKNGISYTAELMSWEKCLAEVIRGEKYDVVFGGGLNDDRRENYITTKGYYSVVPTYFYNKNVFPKGVNVKYPSDFKRFGHLCGVKGFNYFNFGQKNKDIEMGAYNYEKLVLKTLRQRCKISFVRYEILVGWAELLDVDFLNNEDLVFNFVPNIPVESFHLMISKRYKYADEFKAFFESEVNKLQYTKEFQWLSLNPE